jgi:hypothetical protein
MSVQPHGMGMIRHGATPLIVMAGLVPAIHGLFPAGGGAGLRISRPSRSLNSTGPHIMCYT